MWVRALFMQTVNRDRLSANSRITLTAFVEGAYLPWTKEERRASTSKGHHEIWINHIRDHVGELHLREFRTVDASRMVRTIAKENDLIKTTLQHIKSVLSTIFTYAKNEGAFDGANPVDGGIDSQACQRTGRDACLRSRPGSANSRASSASRKEPGRYCRSRGATSR